MSGGPVTLTPEQQAEVQTFAERAVHIVQREKGENRRLRLAHAVAVEELGVLRMALTRADTANAFLILETLIVHHAMHAHDMQREPLPVEVTCIDEAREARIGADLFAGGAA